ncbi:MAG: DUF4327 family protein [Microcystis sp. M038S2]|nr:MULTISPECIES: DUF4327 family protein [unclassified Microcystis]MCA2683747.1 DUF4327 family protein [Microcystis sp. M046S2]MCA2707569.1 DUF4327 family protein [Microcystis sp. M038S2]MCA2948510.1 DUF4327 family protein [Microcystis sp. M109S1]MCA2952016.1 DUF4327 family protein [Microcystis sp. M112S1]
MSAITFSTAPTAYSIRMIKDEVRQMVEQGVVSRHQPREHLTYAMSNYT